MIEKRFSLKNYLEPIDLDYPQSETILEEEKKESIQSYPFTKEQLVSYLTNEEFLSSIDLIEKKLDTVDLQLIIENIPVEKKLQQIQFEKRRRYQAYKLLEYNLSSFTYFDFFSFDSFQIVKNAKFLAHLYKKNEVNSELLLVPFFDINLEIAKLLKEFGFDETFIKNFSTNLKKILLEEKTKQNENKIIFSIKKITQNLEFFWNKYFQSNSENLFNQNIRYSYEIHQIFEKATENGLKRFKTPVITPEILFITLMEEKNSKVGKKIRNILNNETTWYLIRYKLLKRLYYQEVTIRNQIPKNQHFFAYLLKTQLSEAVFEKLIEKKLLSKSVTIFRNVLISNLVKENIFDSFDIETHASISISSKRFYSNSI